jgi:hypothetical protein
MTDCRHCPDAEKPAEPSVPVTNCLNCHEDIMKLIALLDLEISDLKQRLGLR